LGEYGAVCSLLFTTVWHHAVLDVTLSMTDERDGDLKDKATFAVALGWEHFKKSRMEQKFYGYLFK